MTCSRLDLHDNLLTMVMQSEEAMSEKSHVFLIWAGQGLA
jgi:hypothetical protein